MAAPGPGADGSPLRGRPGPGTRPPGRVDDLGDLPAAGRCGAMSGRGRTAGRAGGGAATRTRPVRWRGCCCSRTRTAAWPVSCAGGVRRHHPGHVIVASGPERRAARPRAGAVAQAERWGPLYYPAYLLGSVHGYRRNPFERAAAGGGRPPDLPRGTTGRLARGGGAGHVRAGLRHQVEGEGGPAQAGPVGTEQRVDQQAQEQGQREQGTGDHVLGRRCLLPT